MVIPIASSAAQPQAVRRWSGRFGWIGGLVLLVLAATWFLTGTDDRKPFEKLIVSPIPASVQIIEQGGHRTLDSVFRVVHFKIGSQDLDHLLSSQSYASVAGEELRRYDAQSSSYVDITLQEYLTHWRRRIKEVTKLDLPITNAWRAYVLKEGRGRKNIMCSPDSSEVVFVAEAH